MLQLIKVISVSIILFFSFFIPEKLDETTSVKCMIQMSNYEGEGAYIIISLINQNDNYEKTLYIQGNDPEWYSEIYEWWEFYGSIRSDISAISGATISGGERKISILNIPNSKIDNGYSIRFETAVEDQKYYTKDIQFKLNSANIKSEFEGNGYIRYIRMMNH